jgi:hypothetical protein
MKDDHMEALRAAGQRVIHAQGELAAALTELSAVALDAVRAGAAPEAVGAEYARIVAGQGTPGSAKRPPTTVRTGETIPRQARDAGADHPDRPAPPTSATGRELLAGLYDALPLAMRNQPTADLAPQLAGQAGVTEGTARKYLSAIRSERAGQ